MRPAAGPTGCARPGRPCSSPPWLTWAISAVGGAVDDLGHHDAVAEGDEVADVQVGEQALVVDLDAPPPMLGPSPGTSRIWSPSASIRPPSGIAPARTFGPGRSTMHADRPTDRRLRRRMRRIPVECLVERPVSQPDAGDVHPRLGEVLDHRLGVRRRSDGGDDLGATGHVTVWRRGTAGVVKRTSVGAGRPVSRSSVERVRRCTARPVPTSGRSRRWSMASRRPARPRATRAATRQPPCGRRRPATRPDRRGTGRPARSRRHNRSTRARPSRYSSAVRTSALGVARFTRSVMPMRVVAGAGAGCRGRPSPARPVAAPARTGCRAGRSRRPTSAEYTLGFRPQHSSRMSGPTCVGEGACSGGGHLDATVLAVAPSADAIDGEPGTDEQVATARLVATT